MVCQACFIFLLQSSFLLQSNFLLIYASNASFREASKISSPFSICSSVMVSGAVGHNEISIIIPCHRVIGTNGSLTGYAGGIDKKISLLKLEHTDMSRLFIPKKGTAL